MEIDLDFFELRFAHFLSENHPDIIAEKGDQTKEFIQKKANEAYYIYEEKIKEGTHADAAIECADTSLKEGLIFSKFNFIENILEEYFPLFFKKSLSGNKINDEIIKLINYCKDVFIKYDTTDQYVYSADLETEIIGTLTEIIKE